MTDKLSRERTSFHFSLSLARWALGTCVCVCEDVLTQQLTCHHTLLLSSSSSSSSSCFWPLWWVKAIASKYLLNTCSEEETWPDPQTPAPGGRSQRWPTVGFSSLAVIDISLINRTNTRTDGKFDLIVVKTVSICVLFYPINIWDLSLRLFPVYCQMAPKVNRKWSGRHRSFIELTSSVGMFDWLLERIKVIGWAVGPCCHVNQSTTLIYWSLGWTAANQTAASWQVKHKHTSGCDQYTPSHVRIDWHPEQPWRLKGGEYIWF